MGNFISACTFLGQPLINTSRAARVIFPSGEIRQFREPANAAELMMECPGFFLTNSSSLHIGRRFIPLGADEELQRGNIYIMFPMKRANSVVTPADMALMFMASNSSVKRISGRVSPDSSGEAKELGPISGRRELLRIDQGEGLSAAAAAEQEFRYRLSAGRSKKPTLDTIKEEPTRARR